MQRLFTLGLSIDPNPTNTGMVLWNNNDPVKWADVKPAVNSESQPDWLRMSLRIWNTILMEDPDWISCEGTYIGKNKKVAADIIGIVGSVATYSVFRCIPYFEPSTSQIDSINGIVHTGRKANNLELAKKWIGPVSQDIADALACGMAGKVLYDEYKLRKQIKLVGLPLSE